MRMPSLPFDTRAWPWGSSRSVWRRSWPLGGRECCGRSHDLARPPRRPTRRATYDLSIEPKAQHVLGPALLELCHVGFAERCDEGRVASGVLLLGRACRLVERPKQAGLL